MSHKTRTAVVAGTLLIIALALGLYSWLAKKPTVSSMEPEPGRIHVYVDGHFSANVNPEQVSALSPASFVDPEKGKTQKGPWLKDIVLLYVPEKQLRSDSIITVIGTESGQGPGKKASLTWDQIKDPDNHILFDFSTSGDSVKLVGTSPELDTRSKWVQGDQRIDVTTRP